MSGLLNNSSLNGSATNLQDNTGRPFSASFSAQSGAPSSVFHQSGSVQGLHNLHGSFNIANMAGTLGSRNSTTNNIPSSGLQQQSGNLSSVRFTSNNMPLSLSQIAHGNSRAGMSVVGTPGFNSGTNVISGSIPGIPPTSAPISNRSSIPGVTPLVGNLGSRIASSAGNIGGGGGGGGGIGRSLSSGGGLSIPGLTSRLNLNTNSGSGNLGMQGSNRLMGGMLQQASPQVMSMFGNSYQNSMGMLSDLNNNEGSPFDINDFPQLSSRPSSSNGAQGQIGSLRKQGLGVSPIVQQNQEFSIQNEDFPALPGFKGGNADYSMQMGRSSGFNLGGAFSSHRSQPQHIPSINNQDHLHGSDMFQGSHSSYPSQGFGSPGVGSYNQLIQQYQQQQQQNQSQFQLQQILSASQSYRDLGVKSMQGPQTGPDRFGLLGLLSVVRMSDPDLTSLTLGIDLTTLGLNLNSSEYLYKNFGSPWLDEHEPIKGPPEFNVPQCYFAKQPPVLNQGYLSKFQLNTLFYIFYSMPKDEAQLYAANELYNRGWFYHREHRLWFMRAANMELLVKTNTYERGSYVCFDPNTWETIRKENFVVYYEMLEKRPTLPQH